MPNFKFDNFLAVTIKSEAQKLVGQDHRSSNNYDLRVLRKGSAIKWIIPDGISFDVKEDKRAAVDPITYKGVKNGDITKFPSSDAEWGLYIADPKGAISAFDITIRSVE